MKPITHILLVPAQRPWEGSWADPRWKHQVPGPLGMQVDRDILDEWGGVALDAGEKVPVVCHHRAVVFHSRASVDRYLSREKVSSRQLIDVRTGELLPLPERRKSKYGQR